MRKNRNDDKANILGKAFKGGIWLYIGNLISMALSYLYWLLISKITGSPGLVGEASTIIGVSTIFSTIYLLGLPRGVQRFLGMYTNDRHLFSKYFWTGLIMVSFLGLVTVVALYLLNDVLSKFLPFLADKNVSMLIAALALLIGLKNYVFSYFISKVKTNYSTLITFVSGIAKVMTGVALVYIGLKLLGAVIGYVVFYILLLILSVSFLKNDIYGLRYLEVKVIVDEIKSGMAFYVPSLFTTMGNWLGVISLYGIVSSVSAGAYYIAYNLATLVLMIPTFVSNVALPLLSGSPYGRERETFRIVKLSYAASVPLMVTLAIYSEYLLNLLDKEFTRAVKETIILSSNVPLIAVTTAVVSLVYSYGLYRYVIFINTTINASRTFLYPLLVHQFGSLGAALSFTMGSILGFFSSLLIIKKIKLIFKWKILFLLIIIPLILGMIFYIFKFPFLIGSVLLPALSIMIYGRSRLISKEDLNEIFVSLAPRKLINNRLTSLAAEMLFGD